MQKPVSLLLLLGSLFICSNSISAQPDQKLEHLVDSICSPWTMDGPGGVVGIIDNGELVFSKGYGLASLEYNVPITSSTIFNIASVSKQFTAFAMVLLEQQGKLSLEDDIRKYLPEVPDFGETITIRHLLTHTSGLRNFQNLLSMAGWRQGDAMTNEDLLRFISKQRDLNFPVGSNYLYCNSGFVLCTFIVERITGQDFKDWTRENIFQPLEMDDTEYREDLTRIHLNTATSYDHTESGEYVQPYKYWTYMGNGNVYTTLADLTKWIKNFQTRQLGGEAGIASLTTQGILDSGDTLSYALGLGVSEYRGEPRWSHGGSVGGYRSAFHYYPERALGIVILANHSSANPGGKANEIVSHFLAAPETDAYAAPTKKYSHTQEEMEITAMQQQPFLGSYYVQGVVVDLYEQNDHLYLKAEVVVPQMTLKAASDTSFFIPEARITVFFPREDHDIVILRSNELMTGEKLYTNFSDLAKLAGTYFSPELETSYKISVNGDQLIGYHQRHGTFRLFPLDDDRLIANTIYFADVKVIYDAGDQIKGLEVSNGRVRNLSFKKIE